MRSNYNKFAKLSSNVSRDLESANATQQEFDREQELQNKMEEDLNATLVIVKTKTDQYEKLQEEESQAKEDLLPFLD